MWRDLQPNLSQTSQSVLFLSELVIFTSKQVKGPVAFGAVHIDIKRQIGICPQQKMVFFDFTAFKDFENNKKPLHLFVAEPTTIGEEDKLAEVNLFSNPADLNSMKVKFAFKVLKGGIQSHSVAFECGMNIHGT